MTIAPVDPVSRHRRLLNFSAAAETDGHFTGFDDDRYLAPAVGMFQHARETLVVFQHIDILEGNFAAGEILTGSRSIGSKILAEDENAITDH